MRMSLRGVELLTGVMTVSGEHSTEHLSPSDMCPLQPAVYYVTKYIQTSNFNSIIIGTDNFALSGPHTTQHPTTVVSP